MTDKRGRPHPELTAPQTPKTSPSDAAYWIAYRSSPVGNIALHGPLTLFDAYDAIDKLRRELGAGCQVSTAYRANSRDDAARNAAFYLTMI